MAANWPAVPVALTVLSTIAFTSWNTLPLIDTQFSVAVMIALGLWNALLRTFTVKLREPEVGVVALLLYCRASSKASACAIVKLVLSNTIVRTPLAVVEATL
ncbi:hypothetical protein D3C72_1024060 [compost metagenome]